MPPMDPGMLALARQLEREMFIKAPLEEKGRHLQSINSMIEHNKKDIQKKKPSRSSTHK